MGAWIRRPFASSHSHRGAVWNFSNRTPRLAGALALLLGLAAALGSPDTAAAAPDLQVYFSPSGWSPPGSPVTLTASITNNDAADLSGEILDLVIHTGSQYKPSLVSAVGGYSCKFINKFRFTTPHARCTGGVVAAGGVVDIVYTIPTPPGPLYTASLTYGATGTLSPSGVQSSDSILISDFDGPDLAVNGSVSPANVLVGGTLDYTIHVVNVGFLPTAASTLRVTYPDATTEDVPLPPLAAGASASFAFSFVTTAPGTATASFSADPDNLIAEASEYNNQVTLLAAVSGALADLVISQDQPATAPVSGTYTKTVTVSNTGGVGASGITVRDRFFIADPQSFTADHGFTCVRTTFRVNNSSTRLPNGFQCTGGILAPGESATITAVIKSPWYALTVTDNLTVDPSNTVVESNETNNSVVGSIIIQ